MKNLTSAEREREREKERVTSNLLERETVKSLIYDLTRKKKDGILESNNFNFLIKLIKKADSEDEINNICTLGTTYYKTGLKFTTKLENPTNTIHYLEKQDELCFGKDKIKNKLIIGDNYHALQNLLINYRNKIDVIYIDPPYGCDDLGEFAKTNYDNKITRDNLLSMLEPRLKLAKQLLSNDGVMFCSIDDKNQAYVKCLFDDIFGEKNFIANIIWRKKNTGGGSDKKTIEIETEYVLMYAKNISLVKFNGKDLDYNSFIYEDEYIKERGKYKLTDLDHVSSKSSFQYIESLDYEIKAPDGTMFKNYRNILKPKSYRYTLGKKLFDWMNKNGFILIKKNKEGYWRAFRKIYSKVTVNRRGNNFQIIPRESGNSYSNFLQININENNSIINDGKITTSSGKKELISILNNKDFAFPKPKQLIINLLKMINKGNVTILDFFAGSGTTGQAVLELNREDGGNRQFILCTNNEDNIAYDVTYERLKRVMTGKASNDEKFDWILKNKSYDGSLDVYKISEISAKDSNIFEVINETNYDHPKFQTIKDKIEWVCNNLDVTTNELDE